MCTLLATKNKLLAQMDLLAASMTASTPASATWPRNKLQCTPPPSHSYTNTHGKLGGGSASKLVNDLAVLVGLEGGHGPDALVLCDSLFDVSSRSRGWLRHGTPDTSCKSYHGCGITRRLRKATLSVSSSTLPRPYHLSSTPCRTPQAMRCTTRSSAIT